MYLNQNYDLYTPEDHETWSLLYRRQGETVVKSASAVYKNGYDKLAIDPDRIVNIAEFNKILYDCSGWRIREVSGLVPNKEFFDLLINKQFPVTVFIRKREELDYAKGPDIFHDVIGHVPMLLNEVFSNFMMEFSIISKKYLQHEKAIEYMSSLYWFTLEMGLIREDGIIKPYGGAIITSKDEVKNIFSPASEKHEFDIQKMINTPVKLMIQTEYFIIENYGQLFDSLKDLEYILSEEFSTAKSLPVFTS